MEQATATAKYGDLSAATSLRFVFGRDDGSLGVGYGFVWVN